MTNKKGIHANTKKYKNKIDEKYVKTNALIKVNNDILWFISITKGIVAKKARIFIVTEIMILLLNSKLIT